MPEFREKIISFYKKNILLCFLASFVLGGLIVYFGLERRVGNEYVVEVGDNENISSDEGVNTRLFIDLSGAVNKPGIYEVDQGARVGDLLVLGGGVSDEASKLWVSKNLNLSKVLEDSTKVYIPFEWEFYLPESYKISKTINGQYASNDSSSGNDLPETSNESGVDQTDISDGGSGDTSDSGGVEGNKVNVNTSSSSELDALPGIGPAYAEKIISNRPYEDFEKFESNSGLYSSTVENIKDLISF